MKLNNSNILFIARAPVQGGTENVILQLCEILHDEVNKIVVCAGSGFDKKKLKERKIKYYRIPDIEKKDLRTVIEVSKIIRKIVSDENITVIHTHHRMAAFYVSLLGAYKKCVFINTSHNTFFNKKLLTRYAYKHANLIACGEMVKKNLVDVYGLQDEKVTVIHNAVKAFNGNIAVDSLIDKFHRQRCFVIGNIGRLSEQKGMEYFIKAIPFVIKKHPEARFVIVGSGEDEIKLKKLSEETGVTDYITFLGYRTDVQNLMSQLDLVVLSSLWEGLPLTPIEAFSVGKTVVATAVDGTIEIVRDGIDGYLVEPRNDIQIAEKIQVLIEHPEIRKRMESQAVQRFQDEFSFENLKQKYLEFYEEL